MNPEDSDSLDGSAKRERSCKVVREDYRRSYTPADLEQAISDVINGKLEITQSCLVF